jgi:Uma2 family endonuclease
MKFGKDEIRRKWKKLPAFPEIAIEVVSEAVDRAPTRAIAPNYLII